MQLSGQVFTWPPCRGANEKIYDVRHHRMTAVSIRPEYTYPLV